MSREKATMIVYTDGRVQLPKMVREKLKIKAGDKLSIRVEKGEIIMTPLLKKCIVCEATNGLKVLNGQYICVDCIEKVVDLWQRLRF